MLVIFSAHITKVIDNIHVINTQQQRSRQMPASKFECVRM